jgi:cytochrome b6-f complex iron-sulfur subunit
MKRRKALEKIVIGTGTFFILPTTIMSCEKEPEPDGNGGNGGNDVQINMDEAKYSGLLVAGGFVVEGDIIIANTGNDTFIALSSVCTHQGCTISYDSGNNNFPCPCHGSVYNTSGAVAVGPATTAVKKYNVTRNGNVLTIK